MRDRDSFYGPSEYEQREDREAFLREVGAGGYDEESREERRNRLGAKYQCRECGYVGEARTHCADCGSRYVTPTASNVSTTTTTEVVVVI